MNLINHVWVIISLVLLISAFSCSQDEMPTESNSIRIQVNSGVDILNPALSRLSVSTFIENQMSLPLAEWDDENMNWVPVLIQSYEPRMTEKDVEYSLVIRPEARWSDGQPVQLDDILFTIKMGLNPFISHQSWAAYLDLISDIEVYEDTMVLSLETPYILADEFIAGLTPYPAHSLDTASLLDSIPFDSFKSGQFSDDEEEKLRKLAQVFNIFGSPTRWPEPVSGLFHVNNWIPGQNVTLTRVDNFWGQKVMELTAFYDTNIDTMQFVIIPDPQNALNAFTSGSIDILSSIGDRDSALISSFAGRIHAVPTLQIYYVSVNNTHPLLGNTDIRRSLNMAINRQDMVDRLFEGKGQPAYGPIHPGKYYYTALPVRYDPEKARQMLEEIDCRDADRDGILECPVDGKNLKMSFEIWTTRSHLSRNVATLLKGYWRSIGVDLVIQSADFRSFLPTLQNKTYEMATLALRQNNLLDDPYPLWHSSQSDITGKNYQGLANDSIDYVLEHLRESVIPKNQAVFYAQLQKMFAKQVPVFFLIAPNEAVGVRNGIDLYWTSRRPGYDLLRSGIVR